MGFCFSHCVTKQIKDIQNNYHDSYLIGDIPLSIKSDSGLEDCSFFYEEETWHSSLQQINGASFLDTNQFLDYYKNYKKDQVHLDFLQKINKNTNTFLLYSKNY